MNEACGEILSKLIEFSGMDLFEPLSDLRTIHSVNIDISKPILDIAVQVNTAVRSLKCSMKAIIELGFKINLHDVRWHNRLDSDYNIMGNYGFFIVHYLPELRK